MTPTSRQALRIPQTAVKENKDSEIREEEENGMAKGYTENEFNIKLKRFFPWKQGN